MGVSFVIAAIISDFVIPALINYAISQIASAFIQSAFGKTPQQQETATQNYSAKASGRQQIVRSAIANRNVLYGETKLSGPLIYASTTGVDEKELHLVIALVSHEVESIGDVYFNDIRIPSSAIDADGTVTAGQFAGKAIIRKHLGAPGQVADSRLIAMDAKWTAEHRGDGIAYLYVNLTWDQDVYPTGIPNVSAVVRGRKIYDPRSGLTVYSTNWALCLRDYLASPDYGLGCASDEIDDAAFIAAANVSDERVAGPAYSNTFTADPVADALTFGSPEANLATGHGVRVSSSGALPGGLVAGVTYYYIAAEGGTAKLATTPGNATAGTALDITSAGTGAHTISFYDQVRYTVNGVADTGTKPLDTTKQLISAGGGKIVYTQGIWKAYAGAYRAPVGNLTVADLAGDIDITPRVERKDLYNGVRGTYVSPYNVWQPADFPPVKSATYAAQDGGVEILTDIDLPFTNDAQMARRLAKLMLEKARQSVSVNWPGKYSVFRYDVTDNVMVSVDQLGWSGKEFTIENWKFSQSGGVNLVLQEESAAAYSWGAGDAQSVYAAPSTNLPNPFKVPPPGIPLVTEEIYETTGSAGVKTRAVMTWAASANTFVVGYEAQYKAHNDIDWLPLPPISLLLAQKDDLAPGLYDFRVRAFNSMAVRSPFTAIVTKELLGLTAPPVDITGFSVVASSGSAIAQYSEPTDLDVRIGGKVVVRWTPDLPPLATWANTVIYEEFAGNSVSGVLPLKTGTYFAKAKDSTGHFSVNAASFVVTEGMLGGLTTIATITEDAAFTGTKTNVALVGPAIQVDSATVIDSMASLIDSWGFIDSLGGISGNGTYTFAGSFDGVTVAPRRFETLIRASQFDTGDLLDSRTDLIDSWGLFDGSLVEDCDAQMYVRITNDNPAGSPVWGGWTPFYVADFTCRAAQFRLVLASGAPTHNISIDQLRVTVKS
jgi:hypothetical protein